MAALIGTIAAESAYIDDCLVDTYERTVSDKLYRDTVAVAVFQSMTSLHQRLEVLSKVLRLCAPNAICKNFEEEVRPLVREAAGERAKVIHGSWEVSDDYPDDLILVEASGRLMRWTEKDLSALLDRMMPARGAAHKLATAAYGMGKKKSRTRQPRKRGAPKRAPRPR